ncbi:cbb3-type cytochrome c oxidase subunit 3 [Undibacterium sp.]|jgi:cytochrome c oxidase cbb3-type subunit 4|uniref:cbb3-type cytochrome oxidase subunit 3 n=1 Tax=Undibacterium sp. TaxID=1914977 RepID=UPI002BBDA9D4|nr:cbb3-type cytochrome c oxidase subunit 3 [Undibacterium sp.]HTD05733.1 cbb3-type cytochrome c oxidase subunit 3 [Undibacterium sp.]
MDIINFLTDMRSIMTVVSLLVFLGIVYWSYSSGRKNDFDAAANLPFADEVTDADVPTRVRESQHG